jgi:hypothetical protein
MNFLDIKPKIDGIGVVYRADGSVSVKQDKSHIFRIVKDMLNQVDNLTDDERKAVDQFILTLKEY